MFFHGFSFFFHSVSMSFFIAAILIGSASGDPPGRRHAAETLREKPPDVRQSRHVGVMFFLPPECYKLKTICITMYHLNSFNM